MLTSFGSEERVIGALRAGARGYLMKEAGPSELVAAILSSRAARRCSTPRWPRPSSPRPPARPRRWTPSPPREREVLGLLGEGLTNRQISRRLVISEKTTKHHVGSVLRKLGVTGRTQAALVAARAGLVADEAARVAP